MLRRRLEQTREMACDDLVAERILDGRRYARCLVRIAAAEHTRHACAPGLGITDGGALRARVVRLLSSDRRPPARLSQIAWPMMLLTVAGLVSSRGEVRPVLQQAPASRMSLAMIEPPAAQGVVVPQPPPKPRPATRRVASRPDRPPPPPPPPPPRRIDRADRR